VNSIIFHSNRNYNDTNTIYHPSPTSKSIPKWFSDADMYIKDPNTGEDLKNYWNDGKALSFKGCPALMDIFTSGYVLKTPCDITFTNNNGLINVSVPSGYEDFCAARGPVGQLGKPNGYSDQHFHWFPNWAPELPEGYSALYTNPINNFQLPFLTVAGIIDHDKVNTPGLIPFFLQEGFEGTIPAGTPYIQIIPFQREEWEMSFKMHTPNEIMERFKVVAEKFRTEAGGVYKKVVREAKRFR
jgi:hypothetical protein